jgi:hypothetical protein
MLWLLRISLVGLAAAAMSFVGLALLPDVSLRPGGYAAVATGSVVLWLGLCPLIYRQSLGMAVSVGLMSPLIAIALISPTALFAFFDIRHSLVFPTGALTGVVIRACLSIGQESGRGKAKPAVGQGQVARLRKLERWARR